MTALALILPGHERGEEFRRWTIAAALVVIAHAGLAGAYLLRPATEADGAPEAPAIIIDLAPVPVAPSSQADLAPGPEMIEAQPAPKPPPQTEKELVDSVPEAPAPAEVTLPKPEPKAVEKKPEEQPDDQKVETKSTEQAPPAPRTTASPRSEQNTAQGPAAPSPGSIAASRAQLAQWRDLVAARLQQNKRYPREAEVHRETGVVTLNFSVNRQGKVLSSRIVKSSGHSSLDDEVLAMLRRAEPLPAFGPAMTQSTIQLTVPIQFSLH
jgi:protein TonB